MWDSGFAMMAYTTWNTVPGATGLSNMYDFRWNRPPALDYADDYYVSDDFRKVDLNKRMRLDYAIDRLGDSRGKRHI